MIEAFRRLADCSDMQARHSETATAEMAYQQLGTILIVDDDEVRRELMRKILTRDGYHVLDVPSVEEGARAAAREPIDLLIVDGGDTQRLTISDRTHTVVLNKPLSSRTLIDGVHAMSGFSA